jgi:hypothetical protein
VQRTDGQFLPLVSRNRNDERLLRMLEMPMTSLLAHLDPALLFE